MSGFPRLVPAVIRFEDRSRHVAGDPATAIMDFDFECWGGFAGLRITDRFSLGDLPPEDAAILQKLVHDAGVLDHGFRAEGGAAGPPDVMHYRLHLSDGSRRAALEVSDVTATPPIRALVTKLRSIAIARREGN